MYRIKGNPPPVREPPGVQIAMKAALGKNISLQVERYINLRFQAWFVAGNCFGRWLFIEHGKSPQIQSQFIGKAKQIKIPQPVLIRVSVVDLPIAIPWIDHRVTVFTQGIRCEDRQ